VGPSCKGGKGYKLIAWTIPGGEATGSRMFKRGFFSFAYQEREGT